VPSPELPEHTDQAGASQGDVPPYPTKEELGRFKNQGVIAGDDQAAQVGIDFSKLRHRDAEWRIKARPVVGGTFIVLLLLQNFLLAVLIGGLAIAGDLSHSATLISVVTASTFAETAVIVRIVVKWLFSDIDYK
jgi:hypothetical protein